MNQPNDDTRCQICGGPGDVFADAKGRPVHQDCLITEALRWARTQPDI